MGELHIDDESVYEWDDLETVWSVSIDDDPPHTWSRHSLHKTKVGAVAEGESLSRHSVEPVHVEVWTLRD